MADSIDDIPSPETPVEDSPIGFDEIFNTPDEPIEEPKPEEDKPPTPPPPPTPEPIQVEVPQELNDRLDALEREHLIVKAENELYRKRMESQPPPQAPQPVIDPKEESQRFVQKFNQDPLNALKELIATTIGPELDKTRSISSQETEQKLALVKAADRDRERTLKEYGTLLTSNPEFKAEADRIWEQDFKGQWQPGAMYLAASTAYASLVRAGRLRPASVTPLTPRAAQPRDSIMGDQNRGNPDSPPDPLADFSGPERARIKKTCEQLGIPVADYAKEFSSLKKADPAYGRR